ncbi:glucose dehydrogenase [FAD, quinone]-like isoform X2 [Maniola jurtina]|nr:glucose dehydrogenase [FAD, quinone]-like isoform X2 [Maniola jurtina]XP_045770260.1 glucose dehydrogenase [FAD, quinone]-like isoform X2 [Maniola jurtina]XP_045770261.1 glucose dehydrogenase [FAD, quinone]-like isoform X2 [Maniola jurtina]
MIRAAETCACPIREIGPSMTGSCSSQFVLFMSILESFVNGRCDVADPCNRVTDRGIPDDSYDFVVVGGGTAGSVVAARLSENPQWKVLLIEAGGDEPIPSSVPAWVTAYWGRKDTDWDYSTVPQEKACLDSGGVCSWPRGRMLGGCSVINGMMYMRGNPTDYDGWAVNGATGWSWFEVLPYFLKSEDNREIGNGVSGQYHNIGGPLPVQRFNYAPRFAHDVVSAAIEMGYPPTSDLNGETGTGFTIAQTFNDNGSRYSTARAYLRPASKRENLHILLNAEGSRVIVDPATKKVTGVEYIKNGQKNVVGVNKEVVLSGGTINSPQILLLSGIGPRETLEQFNIPVIMDLPGVGQNLHNHVGVTLEFTLTKEPDVPELSWESAMEYMLKRQGPLSGTGLSQLTGKVNSRLAAAGGRNPDVQFFFGGYSASCGDGSVGDAETLADESNKRTVSVSAIALQPRSRGYLTLQSADPQQPPKLQPNYFLDEHELAVVVDAARIAYRLANTTILREKYGMQPTEGYGSECPGGGPNPTDEFFKCLTKLHTAPENHQAGTCKMGAADDPMAVVDPQLKVYGIDGLRVADASIMPTVVSGNTAGPVVMIGERAAEFVITKYQEQLRNLYGENASSLSSDSDYSASNDRWNNNDSGNDKWDGRWKPWDKHWDDSQWAKPYDHPSQHVDWHRKNNVNQKPHHSR